VFEGFGNAVPEEITAVHGIRPVRFDQKEILLHFGSQLESPFLLFESGQNKAKTVGRIIGAHLIDQALKRAVSEHRGMVQEIRRLEEDHQDIEEKLKPYANLPELEESLRRAEEAYRSAREMQDRLQRLKRLAADLFVIRGDKRETQEKIRRLGRLQEAGEIVGQLERKQERYRRLARLSDQWEQVASEKARCLHVIDQSKELPRAGEWIRSLEAKRDRRMRLVSVDQRLRETQERRNRVEVWIKKLRPVSVSLKSLSSLEKEAARFQVFSRLQSGWISLVSEKKELTAAKEKFRRVPEALELLPSLEFKAARLNGLLGKHQELADVRSRIGIGKEFVGKKEQEAAALMKQWADALRLMGKCPTCGTRVDASVFEHIMEEFGGGLSRAAAGRENQENQRAAGESQK
jgi:exonuclease SbcC